MLNDELVSEREKYTHLEAVNAQTHYNVDELNRELEKLKVGQAKVTYSYMSDTRHASSHFRAVSMT